MSDLIEARKGCVLRSDLKNLDYLMILKMTKYRSRCYLWPTRFSPLPPNDIGRLWEKLPVCGKRYYESAPI